MVNLPARLGIEHGDVGRCSALERSAGEAEDAGGRTRHPIDEIGESEMARLYEICHYHRKRGFQADDSIRRVGELSLLFVVVVGRVIRSDEIDRSVLHAIAQRFDILRGAKRWIHLRVRVVPPNALLRQREMVGADFRSDSYPALLPPANQLDGSLRAHVREVNVPARQPCEEDVADDHDLLRFRLNPLEAELRADDPFVHRSARRERWLLAMVDHGNLEGARVLERRSHQLRARDRLAVIADRDRAGAHHLPEFGQRLPFLTDRDRADRIYARRLGSLRLADDEAHRRLVVGDRISVRHRANRGESSGRGGPRSGRDRLDIFAPRLPQMTVNIDEARRDDESGTVDYIGFFRALYRASHASNRTVNYENVTDLVETLRWIDKSSALEEDRLHSLSSRPRPLPPLAASASSGFPPASR